LTWGFIVVLLAASWQGADMRPVELFRDSSNMASYAADFFPPNFRQWRLYVEEMVITLQIALWGTALAVITAVPMALLASSNIVPWWVYQPVRRLMDACRAINEMVFAMLFVVAVGLGPFAGVLALWIHTSGVGQAVF
jgi:phosphonate transport system permease protein